MDDPGFALEGNYYEKAVRWDETQAQAAESERLGYRLEFLGLNGAGELDLRLLDARGGALTRARLRAEAFPIARSNQPRMLDFHELTNGVYASTLSSARAGLWELRCRADIDGRRFTQTLRIELAKRAAP
ncbi:MAG: FixH family protein [Polyangiaceae bacterium]